MKNVHIPGATRDVGKAQGFVGISVLYTTEVIEVDGKDRECAVMKVAYELDLKEATSLREGGRVILTIVGKPPIIPHRLEVGTT